MGEWHMCYKCMKGCKVAYMVGMEPHCARCMKNAKVKDPRMFLIAKYERHLINLTDDEVMKILEKHIEKDG